VPAAINTVVPGNKRLIKANDSPNAVMNMTSAAQSRMRLDEIEQRLGDIVHEFRREAREGGQTVRGICGSD